VLGVWGSGVSKSCDFYSKRHVLAWTHVVWAILRQNRSRVWPPGRLGKKTEKVTDAHRKDMSPLTQGLNCRSACDMLLYLLKHLNISLNKLINRSVNQQFRHHAAITRRCLNFIFHAKIKRKRKTPIQGHIRPRRRLWKQDGLAEMPVV